MPPLSPRAKRSLSPGAELSRPTKRMDLDSDPTTDSSALEPTARPSKMSKGDREWMEAGGEEHPEGDEDAPATKLEKGKERARVASELPEVVWRRIFEHYYDMTASVWEMENANRGNITPMLISRQLMPVALGVLYRHPHLSYDHLKRFARCVASEQAGTSLSKVRLVRHLTIRASRNKPIKHQEGRGSEPELYYTVHTALKEICSLFSDLTSFTLRDTLVLHFADSKLLFDSLQLLRPRKARIEIRCWDLRDSAVGRQIAAASARNVHDRHTDHVVSPFRVGPPRLWNRVAVSETALMQTSWKDALLCGGELHLPPWWIDPPKLDEPPAAPLHPADNPAAPPPPPTFGRHAGMGLGGAQPTIDEPPSQAASSSAPPSAMLNRTTFRGRPVIGRPAGSCNTETDAAADGPSSSGPSIRTFRSGQSVIEVNHDPYFVAPVAESTFDTASSMPGTGDAEPGTINPNAERPRVELPTSTPDSAATPSRMNLAQRSRMDHLFDTDAAFEEYERNSTSRLDLGGDIGRLGSAATVPPPRSRPDTMRDGGGRADGSELVEQRVREQGANLTSYMLAHEMRACLLKLLDRYWIPRLHSFSFVALDPLASLIVRHPQLEFWARLPIPHIRVHLPRGVHSLAVFKGAKENASDRSRASRRLNLTPEADAPAGAEVGEADVRAENDEELERIVGGDGSGGDLVNDQTRLFEIEVNTVAEMEDERDWIARGEQLPAQACRILVGSSDWREVGSEPTLFSPSFPRSVSSAPPSPSSSQFQSPTFSFVDLDDTDEDMAEGEEGEGYDREAALEQQRRLEGRRRG